MVAITVSLVILLVGLIVSSRLHHQWGPFLLGAMSAFTVVIAIVRVDPVAATIATMSLLGASLWNLLLNRKAVAIARPRRR